MQLNDGFEDSQGNFPVRNDMNEYTRFTIGQGPMVCMYVSVIDILLCWYTEMTSLCNKVTSFMFKVTSSM